MVRVSLAVVELSLAMMEFRMAMGRVSLAMVEVSLAMVGLSIAMVEASIPLGPMVTLDPTIISVLILTLSSTNMPKPSKQCIRQQVLLLQGKLSTRPL